jgi:hypothetical protein
MFGQECVFLISLLRPVATNILKCLREDAPNQGRTRLYVRHQTKGERQVFILAHSLSRATIA